jgi:hypothetical protein
MTLRKRGRPAKPNAVANVNDASLNTLTRYAAAIAPSVIRLLSELLKHSVSPLCPNRRREGRVFEPWLGPALCRLALRRRTCHRTKRREFDP